MNKKVFIIAEAGVNHNGSLLLAKKLVQAAAAAGADAVKFQTFSADHIASIAAPKATYQKRTTGISNSQLNMLKKLELDKESHKRLIKFCKKSKISFLSSAFDLESIDFLCSLGLDTFKVPSGEITNLPYLRKIGALKKKVIISTGMADLKEIGAALKILLSAGTKRDQITILHCITEYPAPFREINLRAIQLLRNKFKMPVGYSDHTLGIAVPIAAVALGAGVIEKHLTLNKKMSGPDQRSSLEPVEFASMVQGIRTVELAMGSMTKKPMPAELKNRQTVRKSIVAARNIKKGEKFTSFNITAKRPGTGLSPMLWDKIMGQAAVRDFKKDELIKI